MRTTVLSGMIGIVFIMLIHCPVFANEPDSLPAAVLSWAKKTGARKKPTATRLFLVNKYGAIKDGKTLHFIHSKSNR